MTPTVLFKTMQSLHDDSTRFKIGIFYCKQFSYAIIVFRQFCCGMLKSVPRCVPILNYMQLQLSFCNICNSFVTNCTTKCTLCFTRLSLWKLVNFYIRFSMVFNFWIDLILQLFSFEYHLCRLKARLSYLIKAWYLWWLFFIKRCITFIDILKKIWIIQKKNLSY